MEPAGDRPGETGVLVLRSGWGYFAAMGPAGDLSGERAGAKAFRVAVRAAMEPARDRPGGLARMDTPATASQLQWSRL